MSEDSRHYNLEKIGDGEYEADTCGGFNPLDRVIIDDDDIKQLNLFGDRFWTNVSDGIKTHVGSNGWPRNLLCLSFKETCNFFITDLYVPTLITLILPFTDNLFGCCVEVLNETARLHGEGELYYPLSLPSELDRGESLQFMPNLKTVFLRDGGCCSDSDFLRSADIWHTLEIETPSGYMNVIDYLKQHRFWKNYHEQGYDVNISELHNNEGCSVTFTKNMFEM